MIRSTSLFAALVGPLCLALSACGDDGSSTAIGGTSAAAATTATSAATSTATPATGGASTTTSAKAAYTLSGVVTGDAGAAVALKGTGGNTTTTDSNGNYSFAAVAVGGYTVTPTQSGHLFSPVSRAETVSTASLTDVVFSASASTATTYTISGTVTGAVSAGVVITLNGTNVGSAVTDMSGNYSFAGLLSGTYVVDATLAGYSFTKPIIIALGTTDSTADDFASSVSTGSEVGFTPVSSLPQATVGTAYAATVGTGASGGTAPYHYQSGLLDSGTPPLGMIVNPNGQLTGTATVAGIYTFTVCALDAIGATSTCEPTSIDVVPAAVVVPPVAAPTPAATVSLTATPATIVAGAASTLTWASTNATTCTASGGWSGAQATSGGVSVKPSTTTTYALSCSGTGGSGKTSVAVTVTPTAPAAVAPTVTLTTSANSIVTGATSTLKWSSTNATSCVGSGGWTGAMDTGGSMGVTPTTTTTYGLTCTGAAGSARASARITVAAPIPEPTVVLTARTPAITAGAASTLTWASTNADSCTAGDGWAGAKADSGTVSVSPTTTTTYTLSCSGAGGTAQASTHVTVSAPAGTTAAPGTSWVYDDGKFDWPGDFNWSSVANYADTSGAPMSGAYDIKMTSAPWGGWLPYAQNWNFNSAPYTKLTFSLKPTRSDQVWQVYFVKVGDIPVGIALNVSKYGPTPVAGQWATYTVPLADLGVLGKPIYKFAIQDQTGANNNVWYIDNVGFVP